MKSDNKSNDGKKNALTEGRQYGSAHSGKPVDDATFDKLILKVSKADIAAARARFALGRALLLRGNKAESGRLEMRKEDAQHLMNDLHIDDAEELHLWAHVVDAYADERAFAKTASPWSSHLDIAREQHVTDCSAGKRNR